MDEQVVTIDIPVDQEDTRIGEVTGATTPQEQVNTDSLQGSISPSIPQETHIVNCPVHGSNITPECPDCRPYKEAKKEEISTENIIPKDPSIPTCSCPIDKPCEHYPTREPVIELIKPKHAGGRPCKYCLDKTYYLQIAEEYLKKYRESEKPIIPFIEELALKMNVDDETLVIWAKKLKKDAIDEYGDNELEHPELSATYALIKTTQKFRLKQRALGRFNPHGALYLLNADHKVIQTNKEVIAGDKTEPLQIEFINEKPLPEGVDE